MGYNGLNIRARTNGSVPKYYILTCWLTRVLWGESEQDSDMMTAADMQDLPGYPTGTVSEQQQNGPGDVFRLSGAA